MYLLVVLIEWQICELVWAFQTGLCKHTLFIAYLFYLFKTGFGLFCKLSRARTFKSSKMRKALLTWTCRVYDSTLAHEGNASFFFYSFSHACARAHTHKHIHTDVILQRDAQILPELTSTKHSPNQQSLGTGMRTESRAKGWVVIQHIPEKSWLNWFLPV